MIREVAARGSFRAVSLIIVASGEPIILGTASDRGECVCKPSSVSVRSTGGNHSATTSVAGRLQRPTRERRATVSLPYSGLLRGLAGRHHHHTAGGLLPHHFTLPARRHCLPTPGARPTTSPAVSSHRSSDDDILIVKQWRRARAVSFCATFRRIAPPGVPSALPCGARTFSCECHAATTRHTLRILYLSGRDAPARLAAGTEAPG